MSEEQDMNDGKEWSQEELEEKFKLRYTDNDTKYMDTVRKPLASPPCVRNWYSRPKRIFDFARGQGNRSHDGRGQNDRGHWRDNRDRRDWNTDRDYHQRDKNYGENRHGGHRDESYGQRRSDHHERGHGQSKEYARNQSGRVYYPGTDHQSHQSSNDNWT